MASIESPSRFPSPVSAASVSALSKESTFRGSRLFRVFLSLLICASRTAVLSISRTSTGSALPVLYLFGWLLAQPLSFLLLDLNSNDISLLGTVFTFILFLI